MNLAFVANLFNNFPALDPADLEEEFEPYIETREEKSKLYIHELETCRCLLEFVLETGCCLPRVALLET